MRLKQLWVVFLLVGVSLNLHGQGTATNLSGTWQLDLEKSTPAKVPFKPVLLTITCVGNEIQMVYMFKGIEEKEKYTADGKEKIVIFNHDVKKVVKAYWRDRVLVIETHQSARNSNIGPAFETYTEFWSLSPDGQTLKHEKDMDVSRGIPDKSKRVAIFNKSVTPD